MGFIYSPDGSLESVLSLDSVAIPVGSDFNYRFEFSIFTDGPLPPGQGPIVPAYTLHPYENY